MNRLSAFGVLIALFACDFNPDAKVPIAAAKAFTRDHARQKLQASAAGDDCTVLLIRSRTAFDDGTVESIHYGTGNYGAYDGGVQQFAEDRNFRAVVYKDADEGLWTYGSITPDEARSMPICR